MLLVLVIGFSPTQSDPCAFILHSRIILMLYVDDILISVKLQDRFEKTNMGEVSLILGMEVTRSYEEGTLVVSQKDYVKRILEKFGMENCNPVSTPGYGPNSR